MDDEFMLLLREQPDERFVTAVRIKLRRIDADKAARNRGNAWWRVATAAGVALSIGLLFAVPAVRVAAQQFLEVFRVTSFVAVPVQRQNIERLGTTFDLSRLIGEQIEFFPPQPSRRTFATAHEAAEAASMSLYVPHYVPNDLALADVHVESERVMRIVASTAKLRSVMDLFEIHDLSVPDSLDGEVAIVTVPTTATLTYRSERSRLELMQARPPEVSLPTGLDLATLGEIALRVLGLKAGEAQRLAHAIDWRGTLVVPISPNVDSFQQIMIQGRQAIHIVLREGGERQVVVWSDGERVYVMRATLKLPELIAVANSLGPM